MNEYAAAQSVIRRFFNDLGFHYIADVQCADLAKSIVDTVDTWRASQPQTLVGKVTDPDVQEPTG